MQVLQTNPALWGLAIIKMWGVIWSLEKMYLYLEEQRKNTAKIPDNSLNCRFHAASGTAAFQVVLPIPRNWDGEYTRGVQWPPSHPSRFLVIIPCHTGYTKKWPWGAVYTDTVEWLKQRKNNVSSCKSIRQGRNKPACLANFRAEQMFLHLQSTRPRRTPDTGHPSVIHLYDEL